MDELKKIKLTNCFFSWLSFHRDKSKKELIKVLNDKIKKYNFYKEKVKKLKGVKNGNRKTTRR